MFAQLNFATARRQRWLRIGSLAIHALLLAWLLHTPEPQLISASSVASGQNGKSVTRLYWPSKSPDDSTQSSSDNATQRYRHQRLSHNKLTWKPSPQTAKSAAPKNPLAHTNAEDNSKTQTLSAAGHGAQAGPPMDRSIVARCLATRFVRLCRSRLPIQWSIPGSCPTMAATR